MTNSVFLHAAIKAVRAAGVIIRDDYGTLQSVSTKKDQSFLTGTDLAAEKEIISILQKQFPDHHFFSEEAGNVGKKSDYVWLIDPLDGTTNFSIQNPFFNTAIALLHKNKSLVSVVYHPLTGELFYAQQGKGAFLNKKPIKVSSLKDSRKGVLTFCHASTDSAIDTACRIYVSLKKHLNRHVRQIGAANLELCYVAAGRTLCYFATEPNPHDLYPGALIAQEAGAVMTDFQGLPFTPKSSGVLVSPKTVHTELLKHLQAALK